MANTTPTTATDWTPAGSPSQGQKWVAGLSTLLVVLVVHWWTLGEIAALVGLGSQPAQAPSDITRPLLTRTITLPAQAPAAEPDSARAAPAPQPREAQPAPPAAPQPASEAFVQAAIHAAPGVEAFPVPPPVPIAPEPLPVALEAVQPPQAAPALEVPLASASAPAPSPVSGEKVAALPLPLPLPVDAAPAPAPLPAPKPEPDPAPVAPLAPPALSPSPAPAVPPAASAKNVEPAAQPAVQPIPSRPLVWPGSKVLAYQLEVNSFPLPARAELRWRHDGAQYEASLALQSLISVVRTSKGAITPLGLEPLRYGEKITARSETAVHFQREKGIVSFSNNKPNVVLLAGMQDEVSVFFQVAAMLGGSPQHFVPGTDIPLQTAESRAVRNMVFVVGKSEVLDLPGGRVPTLYLSHTEPPAYEGARSSKGEIWAAAGLDYLPVRIRITEPSGTTYDLRWSQTLAP